VGSYSLSRREVLNSIVILGSGALLRPLHAQHTDTSVPAVIKGKLTDAATGEQVAAKIRVVETGAGESQSFQYVRLAPRTLHYEKWNFSRPECELGSY
jgi:hypothetical protein